MKNRHPAALFLAGPFFVSVLVTPLPAQKNVCNPGVSSPGYRQRVADPVPEIRVLDVRFEGATKLDLSTQNQIASEIMDVVKDGRQGWLEEMQARVEAAWQHYGFFKVAVIAESRELTTSPEAKGVALAFHITEGKQYRLGRIQFKNARQFNSDQLRRLFPIREDEIFDTSKLGAGLEAMREAYAEDGFINSTAVPETDVDEQGGRISLDVDVDEGQQFHIAGVEVRGAEDKRVHDLLRQFKLGTGEIFDPRKVEEFSRTLNVGDDIYRVIDQKKAEVCLVIRTGPPS